MEYFIEYELEDIIITKDRIPLKIHAIKMNKYYFDKLSEILKTNDIKKLNAFQKTVTLKEDYSKNSKFVYDFAIGIFFVNKEYVHHDIAI
jgi:hypothetical protein